MKMSEIFHGIDTESPFFIYLSTVCYIKKTPRRSGWKTVTEIPGTPAMTFKSWPGNRQKEYPLPAIPGYIPQPAPDRCIEQG
jgi:hypothetical protein